LNKPVRRNHPPDRLPSIPPFLTLKRNFLLPLPSCNRVSLWRRTEKLHAERHDFGALALSTGIRGLGLVECDIFDEEGRLVARASSTCMTLSGARAVKRALPLDLTAYLEDASNSLEQH
jgi:hypothetical protein